MNIVVHMSFFSIGASCNNQHNYIVINGREWSNTHMHSFYSSWLDSHSIDTHLTWSVVGRPQPRRLWMYSGHVTTHEYGSTGKWAHLENTFMGTY